ncbi:hypothetical protein KVT40_007243 [Elsinoe batatas]|uniref:Uncharacterized protein n=1 Tax=Elsinoe batatas TaxID=2601811 RepID=A0A8K0KY23_9PEZI|nr:hypothetical protein KVT40_007243 [Elsinoe batatas]
MSSTRDKHVGPGPIIHYCLWWKDARFKLVDSAGDNDLPDPSFIIAGWSTNERHNSLPPSSQHRRSIVDQDPSSIIVAGKGGGINKLVGSAIDNDAGTHHSLLLADRQAQKLRRLPALEPYSRSSLSASGRARERSCLARPIRWLSRKFQIAASDPRVQIRSARSADLSEPPAMESVQPGDQRLGGGWHGAARFDVAPSYHGANSVNEHKGAGRRRRVRLLGGGIGFWSGSMGSTLGCRLSAISVQPIQTVRHGVGTAICCTSHTCFLSLAGGMARHHIASLRDIKPSNKWSSCPGNRTYLTGPRRSRQSG